MKRFGSSVWFLLSVLAPSVALGSEGHGPAWDPHPALVVPFGLLLLAIACLPLIPGRVSHWWEHNTSKAAVAGVLALPVLLATLAAQPAQLPHTAAEYVQFVILVGSLFVVAGGIHIGGDLRATPWTNTKFLLAGYALASFVGTTGASMIFVFPLLRTNSERKRTVHTFVFFILGVANAGGQLLPVGDPPLYLGFLRGVPFFWWGSKLFWVWVATGVYLHVLYYAVDSIAYRKETQLDRGMDLAAVRPLSVLGGVNVVLLANIVLCTIFTPTPWRELAYVASALASLGISELPSYREARRKNRFGFGPIIEVAVLFAGIFVTMIPALNILELHGASLGVTQPWQYFVATGAFSSVLDNAPTYLIFSQLGMATEGVGSLGEFAERFPSLHAGMSVGAVFMGANTYVGNAPNFMVKATCEAQGVKMPNFFAYALYAVVIMSPVYVAVALALPYIR